MDPSQPPVPSALGGKGASGNPIPVNIKPNEIVAPVLPTRSAPVINAVPVQINNGYASVPSVVLNIVAPPVSEPRGTLDNAGQISLDEIALYDRQIRLWGMTAQKRLATTRVLIVNCGPLAQEVLKNLALAGVASITIADERTTTKECIAGSVLITDEAFIGQPRAIPCGAALRDLNPHVKIETITKPLAEWDPRWLSQFNVVVTTELVTQDLTRLNTMTRLNKIPFYAADDYGMYGYIFADLIEHTYTIKRDCGNVVPKVGPETRTRSIANVRFAREEGKPVEYVTKHELYSTWMYASELGTLPSEILSVPRRKKQVPHVLPYMQALWRYLDEHNGAYPTTRDEIATYTQEIAKSRATLSLDSVAHSRDEAQRIAEFIFNVHASVPPVTAIMGGQLAQDVINMRAGNQPVLQNMMIFDGFESKAVVYALHPPGELGQAQLKMADPATVAQVAGAGTSVGAPAGAGVGGCSNAGAANGGDGDYDGSGKGSE